MLLKVQDVTKKYMMGSVTVTALDGVSLEIEAGEFAAVAGPSGSGKTTLMNIAGLIDKADSGEVVIAGKPTRALDSDALTALRQETLGFIFQSFNLLPPLSVFENVELPLLLARKRLSKKERASRVDYLLDAVGLADRKKHKSAELSGGQQQRAAIARALVCRPKLVIADEPTANLDSASGERVLALMQKANRDEGTTFIFSTHDKVIYDMATHKIFLRDGRIIREERPVRAGSI